MNQIGEKKMDIKMFYIAMLIGISALLGTAGCSQIADVPTAVPTPEKITITFGDKDCSISGPLSAPAGIVEMDWITTSQEHDMYAIAILTLDEGKTIEDLKKWKSFDEPGWSKVLSFRDAEGNSTTELFINIDKGPFYFVCFNPEQIIGALGPVEVIQ
jgi:hypothetical protein